MRESVNLTQAILRILRALLTRSRSQYAALMVFSGMLRSDFLFRIYIFPLYNDMWVLYNYMSVLYNDMMGL